MKKTVLIAALLLAPVARADQVFNLSGIIHQPGESFTYQFTVDEFAPLVNPDGSLFVFDVLNGSVLLHEPSIGCKPCATIYVNDFYEFLTTETVTLANFGNWNLVASLDSVRLVDPVATPEPMTIVLLFVAGLYLWALSLKPRKLATPSDYTANHAYRKGAL